MPRKKYLNKVSSRNRKAVEMECGNALLVVLVLVQCCAVLCNNFFEQNRRKDEDYMNQYVRSSYHYEPFTPVQRLIIYGISAGICVLLLGLLYLCIKCYCPTCCSTFRPGRVIADPAVSVLMTQDQPPPSYYLSAPPPEAAQLYNQPTTLENQHQSLIDPLKAASVQ